ncbi:MAG: hypothetical protein RI957_1849 [Verrucomicrobiota bacterium]
MKEKTDTKRPRVAAEKTTKPKAAVKTQTGKRAKKIATAAMPDSSEQIAVAAFLNWCQRRNQGLPDDPFADWMMAETKMGIAH